MKKWKWVSIVTTLLIITSTPCSNANEASNEKGKIELLSSAKAQIGFVFQQYALFRNMMIMLRMVLR